MRQLIPTGLNWLGLVLSIVLIGACAGQRHPDAQQTIASSAKIDPGIASLARQLASGADPTQSMTGRVRSNDAGQIQVYVTVDDLSTAAQRRLAQRGLHDMIVSRELHTVEGWVAPGDIDAIAGLPFVLMIRPPRYAVTH